MCTEDLSLVREIQIPVHDQRSDLHEIRAPVGRGAVEAEVKEQEQRGQERDEHDADPVQARRVAHQGTPGGLRNAPSQRPAREHAGQDSEEATPEQGEPVAEEPQDRDVPDGQAGGGEQGNVDDPGGAHPRRGCGFARRGQGGPS